MEFKKGDQVRVVDNNLSSWQRPYIGKKGKVIGIDANFTVQFKGKASEQFCYSKLELIDPKRHPFNLKQALAGDAVVTRDGQSATNFREVNNVDYPVMADVGHGHCSFTKNGEYYGQNKESQADLFMLSKPSKPSKSSQIAELKAKVAEQAEKIAASLEFLNGLNTITWGAFTKEGIEEMINKLRV